MTATPPTTPAADSPSAGLSDPVDTPLTRLRPARARALRLVAGTLIGALLTVELVLVAPTVFSAAASLTRSSLSWIAVAAVATVTSMVAFARVRQRMLRAAGVRVSLAGSVAVSYASGALNTTMPGGGVVSTTYTYRRIRRWGAPTAVATWCLAVTGLLAIATLSVVGASGLILSGGSAGSLLQAAAEVTAVLLLMAGIAYLISNPDRLAGSAGVVLRWVNRLRGRPAETGYARLSRVIDDLEVIRPSRRSWVDAWTLSLLNWVLDAGCLAACCAAFGVQVSLPALLLTYAAGMAASGLTPLPGGLGVVEAALLVGLTAAGAPWKAALAAVVVYRLLSVGSVALIGWGVIGIRGLNRAATRTDHGEPPVTCGPAVLNPRTDPLTDPLTDPPTDPSTGPSMDPPTGPSKDAQQNSSRDEPGPAAARPPAAAVVETATRAGDVMRVEPNSVLPGDSWQRVAKTMRRLQVSTVPVCDEHGDLRGIIDYRDIGLWCLAAGGSVATGVSLALDPVVTAGPDDRVETVAGRMAQQRAWLAPVLDGQRLIGVIHYADIVTGPARSAVDEPPASGTVGTDRTPPSSRPVPARPALTVAA